MASSTEYFGSDCPNKINLLLANLRSSGRGFHARVPPGMGARMPPPHGGVKGVALGMGNEELEGSFDRVTYVRTCVSGDTLYVCMYDKKPLTRERAQRLRRCETPEQSATKAFFGEDVDLYEDAASRDPSEFTATAPSGAAELLAEMFREGARCGQQLVLHRGAQAILVLQRSCLGDCSARVDLLPERPGPALSIGIAGAVMTQYHQERRLFLPLAALRLVFETVAAAGEGHLQFAVGWGYGGDNSDLLFAGPLEGFEDPPEYVCGLQLGGWAVELTSEEPPMGVMVREVGEVCIESDPLGWSMQKGRSLATKLARGAFQLRRAMTNGGMDGVWQALDKRRAVAGFCAGAGWSAALRGGPRNWNRDGCRTDPLEDLALFVLCLTVRVGEEACDLDRRLRAMLWNPSDAVMDLPLVKEGDRLPSAEGRLPSLRGLYGTTHEWDCAKGYDLVSAVALGWSPLKDPHLAYHHMGEDGEGDRLRLREFVVRRPSATARPQPFFFRESLSHYTEGFCQMVED